RFVEQELPQALDNQPLHAALDRVNQLKARAKTLLAGPIPPRPPSFCTGCPERPVFSAIKLVEKELGKIHIASDIGCHTFSTLPPFNLGNSVLGYGLGLASASAVAPVFDKRVITVMGDGGFWHNGLTSGVANAVFNNNDSVLIVMNNGYTSATGQQTIPSSTTPAQTQSIQQALRGFGVRWVRTVTTYQVGAMMKTLKEAMRSKQGGLKVIIAESECQLARQRRLRPLLRQRLAAGKRV
ncbi:MAG: indolepyruvate ferredoxin oxidoreductase, partial [Candidatus Competibacteraceae bacterium]|nr:indolepyruvate ferredoxin oxidoreductase [Candidatus Competibacteraceae bacterium]